MAHSPIEMFDSALETFTTLENSNESVQSTQIQTTIKKLMNSLEEITNLVSAMDLFSQNEIFEEIPTENIRFLLLPALLGTLATKLCDTKNRMHLISMSETYFRDFLKRLKSYNVIDIEIPHEGSDGSPDSNSTPTPKSEAELIAGMVSKRNTKIKRYQEKKELEGKLTQLKKICDNPNVDEEIKRDYFVTLLKIFANQAVDELISLAAEKPLVQHMQTVDQSSSLRQNEDRTSTSTVRTQPVIITRDAMQKEVYGLGYPSIPVMSVQEFYDQRIREGGWPGQGHNEHSELRNPAHSHHDVPKGAQKDGADEREEENIQEDDPETLARLRAKDEYKDDHRRGWGNRHNRS